MQLKYARVERERRFLVAGPVVPVAGGTRITDRYLDGTRLRLRRMFGEDCLGDAGSGLTLKLTQKLPASRGRPALITTMYLDEAEYDAFSALPGATLSKFRRSVPPYVVDEFEGELSGLRIAEVEFCTEREKHDLLPAPFVGPEVTGDARLSGARLARATRKEISEALSSYGASLEP